MLDWKGESGAAEQKADFICSTGSEVNMLPDAEGFQSRMGFTNYTEQKQFIHFFSPYLFHIHSSASNT